MTSFNYIRAKLKHDRGTATLSGRLMLAVCQAFRAFQICQIWLPLWLIVITAQPRNLYSCYTHTKILMFYIFGLFLFSTNRQCEHILLPNKHIN